MWSMVLFSLYLLFPDYSLSEEAPLTLTLFYESYCSDCIQFIENQLAVAWQLFKGNMRFDLVPFGKALRSDSIDPEGKYSCQHGPKECLGNKLHACAIWQVCGESGTKDCPPDQMNHLINYILCVEKTKNQLDATPQCAIVEGFDSPAIIHCATSHQGAELNDYYGHRTRNFTHNRMIDFVPTVVFDGVKDAAAAYDLVSEICRARPALCMADPVQTYFKRKKTETSDYFGPFMIMY
uniref:Saposin A-type domain-containing protein n=1 Tax=Graphocephala atropunctata TaxID=36148 RepID=A0A1B6KLV7_9HEMI